jgi:hypothetical protein
MIDNRNYPDARVVMRMDLRPTPSDADTTTKEDWYHDDLPLKGLSTNFFERADARFWALNILVPPWWGDGDAETAGESLIDRALEYFVENEPDRMFLALPGTYFRNRYSFLVNNTERDEVLIVSRLDIQEIVIRCDTRTRKRVLDDAKLAALEVPDQGMDEIRRILAGKVIGLGDLEGVFVYRVRLDDDERGYVRITAQLRGLSIPKGQWTVYRPRPRSSSP